MFSIEKLDWRQAVQLQGESIARLHQKHHLYALLLQDIPGVIITFCFLTCWLKEFFPVSQQFSRHIFSSKISRHFVKFNHLYTAILSHQLAL